MFVGERFWWVGCSAGGRIRAYSGIDGSVLRTWSGNTSQDALGFDANGLGDVNADGSMDFVITSANRNANTGRIYIVSGGMDLSLPSPGLVDQVNTFAGKDFLVDLT